MLMGTSFNLYLRTLAWGSLVMKRRFLTKLQLLESAVLKVYVGTCTSLQMFL